MEQTELFPTVQKEVTLVEARAAVRDAMEDGVLCPCCGQFAKIYQRRITSSMACVLISVYRYFQTPGADEWLHVPRYLEKVCQHGAAKRGGDWAKLVYWSLLEEKPEERDDGSPRAGFYKITEEGKAFVEERQAVPKFVSVYDGHSLEVSKEVVSIRDCLKQRFDYEKLMLGVW